MAKLVEVTELALRDGHQSLLATRMALEDMVPVCEDIDQAGYWSVECWGGATYDSCIRFLNEDPWERLADISQTDAQQPPADAAARSEPARLPPLRRQRGRSIRGQSGGERHGCLSRLRCAERRPQSAPALSTPSGGPASTPKGTICYTTSPLHTIDKFVEMAEQLRELGCDSICIKDMAALLRPQPAYDLVRGIKEKCGEDTLVHVHVHSTTGVTLVSLMKAIEAGADIVDTSISSLSLGPGHNPTEALVEMLARDRLYDAAGQGPAVEDQGALCQDTSAVRRVRIEVHRRRNTDLRQPDSGRHDLEHGKPTQATGCRRSGRRGDGRSAERAQDAGYPPLVTPSSQIVGTQAVFNVLMGRYKVLTGEFADLMLGYYGETIGPRDPEVVEGRQPPRQEEADHGPARRSAQTGMGRAACTQALALDGCNGSDEDVLTYAMFPQVAPKFFAHRTEGPKNLSKTSRRSHGGGRSGRRQDTRLEPCRLQGQDRGQLVAPAVTVEPA